MLFHYRRTSFLDQSIQKKTFYLILKREALIMNAASIDITCEEFDAQTDDTVFCAKRFLFLLCESLEMFAATLLGCFLIVGVVQLHDVRKIFTAWGQFDFLPHKILFILMIISYFAPRPPKSRRSNPESRASIDTAEKKTA